MSKATAQKTSKQALDPIAASILGRPGLFSLGREELVLSCLRSLSRSEVYEKLSASPEVTETFWYPTDDYRSTYRPYKVQNGILQIPVAGVLLHKFAWTVNGWVTGYTYLQKALERGLSDPEVDGIAFMIDSPGGSAAGVFDLADVIYAARDVKPIRAIVDADAYSAAYAIASATQKILIARVGGVGSVGVVITHYDYSALLEDVGIKITFVHSGKYKVEGNFTEPLSDEARDRIQTECDEIYDIFVGQVARNRGMTEEAVRATEALCFPTSQALEVGFADKVATADEALADFVADVATPTGEYPMDKDKEAAAAAAKAAAETNTKAAADAARKEGADTGATAAKERIAKILSLDEAKGREATAQSLALNTDLTVEQAKAVLATVPAAVSGKPEAPNQFLNAMDKGKNPEVGAGADAENQGVSVADKVLADAGLIKPGQRLN